MPKAIRKLPPVRFLRECFDYEPETGVLRWRERPKKHFVSLRGGMAWNARYAGSEVGWMMPTGHLQTSIDDRKTSVARIIWKLHYGTDPRLIDHIDRDPKNNRLSNLRSVNDRQNAVNKIRPVIDGRLTGVTLVKNIKHHGRRFAAQIGYEGRHYYLGVYYTAEEAHAAYVVAANKLFGEYSPFRYHNTAP